MTIASLLYLDYNKKYDYGSAEYLGDGRQGGGSCMRLENFRAFLLTAKNHSMTKASEELFTTPQNISKLISELEKDMGVKLFAKTRGSMVLSEAGEKAYVVLERILEQYQMLQHGFLADSEKLAESRKPLRILASYAAAECLAGVFDELLRVDAHSLLEMIEADFVNILHKVAEEAMLADYIFVQTSMTEFNKYRSRLEAVYDLYVLQEERLRVFMNRQAEYAQHKSISLKQLSSLPLSGFAFDLETAGGCTYDVITKDTGIDLQIVFSGSKADGWKTYLKNNRAYILATTDLMKDIKREMGEALISVPLREKQYVCLLMCKKRDDSTRAERQNLDELIGKQYRRTLHQL